MRQPSAAPHHKKHSPQPALSQAEVQASDKATGSGQFDNQQLKQEADARANAKCRGSVVLIRKIKVDYEAEAFKWDDGIGFL